jgi:hypothetical protein
MVKSAQIRGLAKIHRAVAMIPIVKVRKFASTTPAFEGAEIITTVTWAKCVMTVNVLLCRGVEVTMTAVAVKSVKTAPVLVAVGIIPNAPTVLPVRMDNVKLLMNAKMH